MSPRWSFQQERSRASSRSSSSLEGLKISVKQKHCVYAIIFILGFSQDIFNLNNVLLNTSVWENYICYNRVSFYEQEITLCINKCNGKKNLKPE